MNPCENGRKCEVNNLKTKVIELENALQVKERKIRYLETKLDNKMGKLVPCNTSYTQASFQQLQWGECSKIFNHQVLSISERKIEERVG